MLITKTYPEHLSEHISLFYSVTTSNLEDLRTVHRRLPDGTLDVVFNLGATVFHSRDGQHFIEMPDVCLTGLYPDRNFLRYSGEVYLIGAVFKPGSAHLFVNDNLQHFEECFDDASLLFGKEVHTIREQLGILINEKEKHRLIEGFLIKRLKENNDNYNSGKISSAISQIHALKGNVEMPFLYKNNGMSERNFRRKFHEFVGMSPKRYSTIIRVKSFSKLYNGTKESYFDILDTLNYTDSSHFNKDFQKIVGISPGAYFRQINTVAEEFIHLI